LRKLAFSLIERGFKGSGINLEQQIAFFDWVTLLIVLCLEITCDLSPNMSVNQSVENSNPLVVDWNISRCHCGDFDSRRWRRCGLLLAFAATEAKKSCDENPGPSSDEQFHWFDEWQIRLQPAEITSKPRK